MSSVNSLIELQNIDSQLREIKDILGDLPNKVEDSIQEEKEVNESILKNKQRVKEIQLNLSKVELRVKEDNVKIDHLKDQLFKVTTNKQYDAIMLEIDHLKEQLDKDETVDIELMEEKDSLDKQIIEQESNVETLSKDLSNKRQSLEKMLLESSEQKEQLEISRTAISKNIEPHIVKRYEIIRKARRGTAVVAVIGSSCSGCGAMVPLQKIAEIRSDKTPHTCDECSRFLHFQYATNKNSQKTE